MKFIVTAIFQGRIKCWKKTLLKAKHWYGNHKYLPSPVLYPVGPYVKFWVIWLAQGCKGEKSIDNFIATFDSDFFIFSWTNCSATNRGRGSMRIFSIFQLLTKWRLIVPKFELQKTGLYRSKKLAPIKLKSTSRVRLGNLITSVMRVGSDTFGDPIFQKGLQN